MFVYACLIELLFGWVGWLVFMVSVIKCILMFDRVVDFGLGWVGLD